MAVASLPMYDLPEARPAWTRSGDRARLRRAGLEVPAPLAYPSRVPALWSAPELLFGQSCGPDLTVAPGATLQPVATPRYRAPGCAGARYASLLVVSDATAIAVVEDLRGRIAAVNQPRSHSGANELRALVAPSREPGGSSPSSWRAAATPRASRWSRRAGPTSRRSTA